MPGSEDYPYIDPTATPAAPAGLGTTEATAGELNPAFYFQAYGGALKDEDFTADGAPATTEVGRVEAATSQRSDDQMGPSRGIVAQAPARPDGNDSTALWRAYAQEMGTAHEQASTMTRADVQKKYPA